jgi:8-oxo-dGTP pyrophosphatase MutT (NUDIX family)
VTAFRVTGEREVWTGPLLRLAVATVDGPGGGSFEREVVHHPGAVSVVPVVDDGAAVLMVRQYRAPLDRLLLEIPAGKRDVPGEPPETTARRELEEEVGMRAGRLEKLAEFYNSPGFCDEHSWVFMALDLAPAASSAHSEEEQHMTIERVLLDDVPGLIASGALMDAKSIIGLCLARDALA